MIVAFRAKPEDEWTIHRCQLSGRIHLDAYAACYQARRYVRDGWSEAQVMDGDVVFARFVRGPAGTIAQEGGVDL